MKELTQKSGNVPVVVAARVLGMDCQTIRLLLQNRVVDWGIAFKLNGSNRFSYIIYASKFYDATGFMYAGKENAS